MYHSLNPARQFSNQSSPSKLNPNLPPSDTSTAAPPPAQSPHRPSPLPTSIPQPAGPLYTNEKGKGVDRNQYRTSSESGLQNSPEFFRSCEHIFDQP
ncbi:hypothetical protein BPAE_0626g00010 [Botrytis paeoniae]|uniref:Uncharacterized protein n=1 Tax=Botrytis paeoniae TaxID=278948 RepID=A0A4Z1EZL5_9HELO|nr:hypothetical protein BPAE_0626g00010 [Botrytis paeoniae]